MTERRSDESWDLEINPFSSRWQKVEHVIAAIRVEERLAARVEFAEEIIAKYDRQGEVATWESVQAHPDDLRAMARQPGPAKEEE